MRLQLSGRHAVVTGAASGIGRGVSLALATRGCHLALIDRDEAGLARVAAEVALKNVRVSTYVVDLTNAQAIAELPGLIATEHPGVSVLVNNAGSSIVGAFHELTLDEFRWVMDTNFWSVVAMTKAFLPTLLRADAAQIANISSIFGIIAPAHQPAYASSKFAVRGFSESLRHELARTSVGVTVVHPGGVKTAITRNSRISSGADPRRASADLARFNKVLRMPPEKAGELIVRAIERRRPRVLIGSDAVFMDKLQRLFPATYWRTLERLFARALPKH